MDDFKSGTERKTIGSSDGGKIHEKPKMSYNFPKQTSGAKVDVRGGVRKMNHGNCGTQGKR